MVVVSHLQQVSVMDLHAAAGALVLGRRRRAETGGLRRSGFTGLLLHLQFRLRLKKQRFYKKEKTVFCASSKNVLYF